MRFDIENGFLEYDKLGNGIPLLFVHGYPLSRKIWNPQLEGLSEFGTMVSIDLRGHGDSFPFDGPYSMDLLANDCKKLLDNLQIDSPVVVCGLSMGGYITIALYRKYPNLFRGMILTSTRPGPDSEEGKKNRNVAILDAHQYGASIIADNMVPKLFSPVTLAEYPDLVNMIHNMIANTSIKGIIGALQGMRDRPDSTSLLNQVRCPVLLIHGKDDQLIPLKEAETMDEQIPDSRLCKINNAGHLPNLEQPNRFNDEVKAFLLSLN